MSKKAKQAEVNEPKPISTIAEALMLLAVPQATIPRLWPCFMGPTGSGKTARARQLAVTLGRPLVSPPLTQGLPEDFTGLPRVTPKGYSWHLPPWALQAIAEPCVVFLDEIDKCSEEHQKVLLPLLHELELHGTPLHPETVFVCAMQQPLETWTQTETGKALIARLVILPIEADAKWLADKYHMDFSGITFASTHVSLIPTHPSMRVIDWLLSFFGRHLRNAEPVCRRIGQSLLGAALCESLITRYKEQVVCTPASLCAALNERVADVELLTPAELANLGAYAILACTLPTYQAVLERLMIAGTEEDAKIFFEAQAKAVDDAFKANGGKEIELLPGSDEATCIAELNKSAQRIGEAWIAANKAAEQAQTKV